jgi:hypothetical protein
LDAYLFAWIAGLDETDRLPLGVPPDDVIWVSQSLMHHRRHNRLRQLPQRKFNQSKAAPASCVRPAVRTGSPVGLGDGILDAAHACRGLTEIEPERRKADSACDFISTSKADIALPGRIFESRARS